MKMNRLLVGIVCTSMAIAQMPVNVFATAFDVDEESVEVFVEENQNEIDETEGKDIFNDDNWDPNFEWTSFSDEIIIKKYIGPGGEVVIPAYATWIDEEAFAGNQTVTKVSFEKNSKCSLIHDKAFYGCTNLTEISFPDCSFLCMYDYSFANSGLTHVKFNPDCDYVIGNGDFNGCPIISVDLPRKYGVNYGGDGIFVDCPIESITFADGGQDFMPDYLFMNADLSKVDLVIPKWIKSIHNFTFKNSKLKKLTFETGSQLELIWQETFADNPLTSVEFPDNSKFEGICDNSFRNTKLVDVVLPASASRIERGALAEISTLRSITFRRRTGVIRFGKSYVSENYTGIDEEELVDWEEYAGLEVYCYKGSPVEKFFSYYNEWVKKKYGASLPEDRIPYIVIREIKGDGPDEPIPEVVGGTYVVGQKFDVTVERFLGKSYARYDIVPKGAVSIKKGIVTVSKAPADGRITITGIVKDGKKDKKEKSFVFTAEKPAFSCGSKGVTLTRPYYEDINPDDDKARVDASTLLTNTTLTPSKWISSKETVAVVDPATGLVMAKSKGSAKISAIFGDPDTDRCAKYTFTVKVNLPKISKEKVTLLSGQTQTLKINGADKGAMIAWSSSVPEAVFVEATTGRLTALKYNEETEGKVTLQGSINGVAFPCYACEVTVKKPELTKSEIKLKVGKTAKIGIKNTKLKTNTGDITFTSSDPTKVEVDKNGKVKALEKGDATITVYVAGVELPVTVKVQ